jgi:signal transduction histidine kinase
VGASVILNFGLSTLYERTERMTGRELALHLSFDLIQAGVLLFLTGGLANPFSLLLIVPVTIAATLLTAREMAPLLALTLAVLVVIWLWAQPLPWSGPPPEFPLIYRVGDVIAYGLAIGFLAAYLWMVSAEARTRARALVATEAALTREARMNALGSLAAAAAHELGGPLGSISLIAHSLEEELGDDPDFGEDFRLLAAEAARSRRIMKDLSTRAEAEAMRWRIAARHGISDEDAELFLTGSDEDTLARQAERFKELAVKPSKGTIVPGIGNQPNNPASIADQVAAAEAAGNFKLAIALKSQQLADLARKTN